MADIKQFDNAGKFNTVPEGWREITEGDFAQSLFFMYEPVGHEFRQVKQATGPYLSVRMFHMHDGTGFAMYSDYWAKKVRYFAFGCEHEWGGKLTEDEKKVTVFRTTNVHKCKKCGYFLITDSSD